MNRLNQTYCKTNIYTQHCSVATGYPSSGKEKDSETGLSYFGARYYEPGMLNVWLSVDPMAGKYPSMTPYAYCAWTRPTGGDEHRWIKYNIVNNPIKLVDPDGRDIWIIDEDNKPTLYYINMSTDQLSGFSKIVADGLNSIYNSGDWGMDLISSLAKSRNVFNIRNQEMELSEFVPESKMDACFNNNQCASNNEDSWLKAGRNKNSGGDVLWNPSGYLIFTEKGLRNDTVYQLLHELCHAYDANGGNMSGSLFKGIDIDEWNACIRANIIGKDMGFPKQTIYGGEADNNGVYIEGTGIRLYDNNDNPIFPNKL